MAKTQVTSGFGASFQTGDGGNPETFTAYGEVTNDLPFELSRDVIDASHQQSPGAMREKIVGMGDAGEISIEFNFVPGSTQFAAVEAEFAAGSPFKNRRLVWPDGSYFAFSGAVTKLGGMSPMDDKMGGSFTCTISGDVTFVQA